MRKEISSRGTKQGQLSISHGEFMNAIGRKDVIYAFANTMFAIKHSFAHVRNTDQNFTGKTFHPIGLELIKIP